MNSTDPRDRLLDLLAAAATEGLSNADRTDLADLRAAFPDEDPDAFDFAAAAADLAIDPGPHPPLPAALFARIERDAAQYLPPPPEPARASAQKPRRQRTSVLAWGGWVVAAGLAGFLVWSNVGNRPDADPIGKLRRDPTATAFAGIKPGTPTVTGEVVWSDARQEGYLRVGGLIPNDPTKEQYQLWVVDATRPGSEPIDGGVFDVGPDGTAVVRVRNPIPVGQAQLFAITKERAGGVVVAKGPHVLVLTTSGG